MSEELPPGTLVCIPNADGGTPWPGEVIEPVPNRKGIVLVKVGKIRVRLAAVQLEVLK